MAAIIFAGIVGLVCFALGRAFRMNHGIKHRPDDWAVNLQTGEVIERGSAAWNLAVCEGNLATTLKRQNGAR
jgi:hypothetical protein